MTCPPCNGDCAQSDECPARALPITMEDEPPSVYEMLWDFGKALIYAVGCVTISATLVMATWRFLP